MKRASLCAAALAVALGVAVLAGSASATPTGSVTPSLTAGDVTSCNGTTTVQLTVTGTEPPPEQRALDVELVLDESGSVSASSFNAMKSGAASFANSLMTGINQLGLVMFSTDARVVFHPTLVRASAVNGINSVIQRGGNTAIGDGLSLAQQELVAYGRPNVQRVIILETDGMNNVNTSLLPSVVGSIKSAGTLIFTVGIGASVDQSQLNFIASSIPGVQTTYFNPDYATLATTLETIAGSVTVPAATSLTYNATASPDFTVTGATASAGSIGHTATGVTWSLPSLGTQTVTVTYTLQHTGTTDAAAAPIHSAATLHYTDSAAQPQSVDYGGATVAVSGCNRPPTANAGPDQLVDLSGSHAAGVQLDGSGSTDDGLPDGTLTYTWTEGATQLATGVNPTVPLGLGMHDITLTVSDGVLSSTDDVVVTVEDPTPPVIASSVSGTLGAGGWYASDATVSWTVTDQESDVTSSTGCGDATLAADTTGRAFTCQATSAGGTSSGSVTVKRDATPPTVTYSGNAGTYSLADTISITCSAHDDTSGVASDTCSNLSEPAYAAPGTTTLHASATDAAGNVGTGSTTFTVTVDSAGVCALIGTWVPSKGVANSLCVKVGHGSVGAFTNEANADVKSGRLTRDQADVLIRLVHSL